MDRREFLIATAAAAGTAAVAAAQPASAPSSKPAPPLKGNIKQSVCRWCYQSIPIDDLCRQAAEIGCSSVELLTEKEWSIPTKYGLSCAVAMGPTSIAKGLNRIEHHDAILAESERLLPLVKAAAIPNMIVFSGNRTGLGDDEGIANCIAGLKRLLPTAERLGITIIMEMLNSKVDHHDYHADHTAWAVRVAQGAGSDRFKLLYDIYHMQIMEGDVIRTIRDHHRHIAHYHTGGVPGRHEIDQSQELNYPAICRAIVETGFTGYLGQEFIPSHDPIASLREAVSICDV